MTRDPDGRSSAWRLRGVIGALSLIVLGWILGMATDRVVLAREPAADPTAAHGDAIASFREELGLTPDETARLHEVLIRHQREVDATWSRLRAHLLEQIELAHDDIRALLTPEQRERFERWLERYIREQPDGDAVLRWLH